MFRSFSKTCADSYDVFEISNLTSDWILQKVEHKQLQIQVPYCMQSMLLILSLPSKNAALFLVLCGFFHIFIIINASLPSVVSGVTKSISWPININNMGKNFSYFECGSIWISNQPLRRIYISWELYQRWKSVKT